MLLLGATFTSEYAIEAAALCNPSIVAHPDQAGVAAGSLRFVMSVRGIGEGHRSSLGFRTGVVDAEGGVTVDAPDRFATVGSVGSTLLDAAVFRTELARLRNGGEAADYVLDALGDSFTRADLDEQLDTLQTHMSTRGRAQQTISLIRDIAERFYAVEFADEIPLSERVLFPAMGAEAAGMEDARFVRFVEDDGSVRYLRDVYGVQRKPASASSCWRRRTSGRSRRGRWSGKAAANKGLALFPRRIGGRFAAMSQVGPGIEFGCVLRMIRSFGRTRSRARSRRRRGRRCSSATAGRRSRPRPGGWC